MTTSEPVIQHHDAISIVNPEDHMENEDDLKRDREVELLTPSYRTTSGSVKTPSRAREHTSDVLDSVQILSIPLQDERDLIWEYFPHRRGSTDQRTGDQSNEFERTFGRNIEYFVIEYTMNLDIGPETRDLSDCDRIRVCFKCFNSYPNESGSCTVDIVECTFLDMEEKNMLQNKLNIMALNQCKKRHNCILMILMHLENRLSVIAHLNTTPSSISPSLPTERTNLTKAPSKVPALSPLGTSTSSVVALNLSTDQHGTGFFEPLNAESESQSPVLLAAGSKKAVNKKQNPSSSKDSKRVSTFTSFQDVLTTKTPSERKKEAEFAKVDKTVICPKMFGAVWGRGGQLIVFGNVLNKKVRNSRREALRRERDDLRSFQDYNRYIERCGASHIHSQELHQIRKEVFARHYDEGSDRFSSEFVDRFSLFHQHQSHRGSRRHKSHSHRTSLTNGRKNSLNSARKSRRMNGRNSHKHRNGHSAPSSSMSTVAKQGNARIFTPGIALFHKSCAFSSKLVAKCKLTAGETRTVAELCTYNGKLCASLGLHRVSKVLNRLSVFLRTKESGNVVVPSPYHRNYMVTFVQKAIDELYYHNQIQGIAIVACLLRQSQFSVLLFYESDTSSCGHLLQSCVMQYLRVIKNRIEDEDIQDVEELEHFSVSLMQQRQMMNKLSGPQ